MYPELTNLLPENRVRGLRRDYFYRLGTVVLVLLMLVVLVHGVFLMPSYQYVEKQISDRSATLSGIQASLTSSDEAALDSRVTALTKRANALTALGASPSQSALIAQVLGVAHPGIQLTGFTLTPATSGTGAIIVVRGNASTRDSLRAYDLALSSVTFISNVNLPVSAYAQASDISFSITLTMTP